MFLWLRKAWLLFRKVIKTTFYNSYHGISKIFQRFFYLPIILISRLNNIWYSAYLVTLHVEYFTWIEKSCPLCDKFGCQSQFIVHRGSARWGHSVPNNRSDFTPSGPRQLGFVVPPGCVARRAARSRGLRRHCRGAYPREIGAIAVMIRAATRSG